MPFDSPFSAIQATAGQRADRITLVESANATGASGPQALGQFEFNAGSFPGTSFEFEAVVSVSDGGLTGTVQLYNITDGELVASSTLNTSSTTPVQLDATLTVGSAAGEFQDTSKLYEVRLSVSGGTEPTDIVTLGSAILRLS